MNVDAVRATTSGLCSRASSPGSRRSTGEPFRRDEWTRPEGGGGIARVIEDGDVLRARRRQLLARDRRQAAAVGDRGAPGARRPRMGGDGRVARPASAQSVRRRRCT